MRTVAVTFLLVLAVSPASAQRRLELIADVEGVHRDRQVRFEPNTVRFDPEFQAGGGAGFGLNWILSDRLSLEMKAAALATRLRLRRTGGDFVATADLGYAELYPLMAVLQWHMLERGSIRPYIGAGVSHVILRNIDKETIGITGIDFEDPTGLVVNGGLRFPFGDRWNALADARYTPIETQARARFIGTTAVSEIDVNPLIVSFGLAYRF